MARARTRRHGRNRKVIMQMKLLSVRLSKHAGRSVGGHASDLPRRTSAPQPSEGILYSASWFRPARVQGGSGPLQRRPLMPAPDRDIVRQSDNDVGGKSWWSDTFNCTRGVTFDIACRFIVITERVSLL